jgi:hypothetical protein
MHGDEYTHPYFNGYSYENPYPYPNKYSDLFTHIHAFQYSDGFEDAFSDEHAGSDRNGDTNSHTGGQWNAGDLPESLRHRAGSLNGSFDGVFGREGPDFHDGFPESSRQDLSRCFGWI